jgi:hypothetical protein
MNQTEKTGSGGLALLGRQRGLGTWLLFVGMICVSLCAPGTWAVAADPHPVHRGHTGTLEDRVETLSKALALDASQQAQLMKILTQQRETVRKIWSGTVLSPAERTPATMAANERTADEIRSVLNEEQKRKYNPPKPSAHTEPREGRSVEQWLGGPAPR